MSRWPDCSPAATVARYSSGNTRREIGQAVGERVAFHDLGAHAHDDAADARAAPSAPRPRAALLPAAGRSAPASRSGASAARDLPAEMPRRSENCLRSRRFSVCCTSLTATGSRLWSRSICRTARAVSPSRTPLRSRPVGSTAVYSKALNYFSGRKRPRPFRHTCGQRRDSCRTSPRASRAALPRSS